MRYYFLISFLLSFGNVNAQETAFSKYYQIPDITSFTDQAYDPSGFWFMLSDQHITKIDNNGNKLWEKKLATEVSKTLKTIAFKGMGHFVVTAYDFSYETIHFLEIDADGKIIKEVKNAKKVTDGDHLFIGVDSVLVVGRKKDPNQREAGFADLYSSKTGDVLWTYFSSLNNVDFIKAKRISNSKIALMGRNGESLLSRGVLATIDLNGKEQWMQTYDSETHCTINDVALSDDLTFRAILWKEKASEFLKLSSEGVLITKLELPFTVARYIIEDSDNSFVVAGASRNRIALTKISEDSKVIWWRYYGSGVKSEFGDVVNGLVRFNTSLLMYGNFRKDSRSYPYIIKANKEGIVKSDLPTDLKSPKKRLALPENIKTGEAKIMSSAITQTNEIVLSGSYYKKVSYQTEPISVGFAAKANPLGDTVWTKDFLIQAPYGYYNTAISNIKSTSGGKLLMHESGGTSSLIEIDSENKLIGSTKVNGGRRSDFEEIANGNILMCKHHFDLQPYNEVGTFASIDLRTQSSNQLSPRLIGTMIHNIVPTGKNTFYVTGEQIETYKVSRQAYWSEVDEQGNALQVKTYNLGYKTFINDTKINKQGNIICAGAVENEAGNKDLLLMEVNPKGELLWSKTYDILLQDEILSILVLNNGYVVAGEVGKPIFGLQQSFSFVSKITLNGEMTSKQFVGVEGLYTNAQAIYAKNDSSFILVGNSEFRIKDAPSFDNEGFMETINMGTPVVTSLEEGTPIIYKTYPNPFNDRLIINCSGKFKASLVSLQGQVLLTAKPSNDCLAFDTSFLEEGVYIVFLEGDSKIYKKKVIKVRS